MNCFFSSLLLLTYSCDHQQLPEEQQQVCHFIKHHDPEGTQSQRNTTLLTESLKHMQIYLCYQQVRQHVANQHWKH